MAMFPIQSRWATCGITHPTPSNRTEFQSHFPPNPTHQGLQSTVLLPSTTLCSWPCFPSRVGWATCGITHPTSSNRTEFQSHIPPNPYPPGVTKYSSLTFHHLVFMAMVPIQSRVSNSWQLTWAIKFWSSAITARSSAVRWPNDSSSFTSRVCDRVSFSS